MKKLFVLFFLLSCCVVYGQENRLAFDVQQAKKSNVVFENATLDRVSSDLRVLAHFENPDEVCSFGKISLNLKNRDIKAIRLTLPLGNKDLVLELVEVPNSSADLITQDGEIVSFNRDIKHYRGIVQDDENSIVAISFFEDEIMGMVCTGEGNYNISKDVQSGKHIFFNDRNLKEKNNFVCGTKDDLSSSFFIPKNLPVPKGREPGNPHPISLKAVNVFVEACYSLYQQKKESLFPYLLGLFNQVSTIYYREGILLNMSPFIYTWKVPDPYTYPDGSIESLVQILTEFQTVRTQIAGDLGILLYKTYGSGGIAAGFDALCNPDVKEQLAVACANMIYEEFPIYSRTVQLISHELGHLFGSRHTHACVWNGNNTVIDCCGGMEGYCLPCPPYPVEEGGTIMSYCDNYWQIGINFANGFGVQPGDLIRQNLAEAYCICQSNIVDYYIYEDETIHGCDVLNMADVVVNGNATVDIIAKEAVVLKPFFRAHPGTNVHIYIHDLSESPNRMPFQIFGNNNELPSESQNLSSLETTNKDLENKVFHFTLIPNPNRGTFQIETNFSLSEISQLKITNTLGLTVYETRNLASNEIQLQNSAPGLYFVVMVLKDGTVLTQKMVVQR